MKREFELLAAADRTHPCCVPSKQRAALLEIPARPFERMTGGAVEGMAKLDGGAFLMGTNSTEGFPNDGEGPVREITLDPFYIDQRRLRTRSSPSSFALPPIERKQSALDGPSFFRDTFPKSVAQRWWMIRSSPRRGGARFQPPTGSIPKVPIPASRIEMIIPSRMFPGTTRRSSRAGQGSDCLRRPSGNSPPAGA